MRPTFKVFEERADRFRCIISQHFFKREISKLASSVLGLFCEICGWVNMKSPTALYVCLIDIQFTHLYKKSMFD